MNPLASLAHGVVVAGFDGTTAPSELLPFAGFILFARNGESVATMRALTDTLREGHAPDAPPQLIALDQEGGRVVRLREGVETLPSAMAMGAAGDAGMVERAGEQAAFDLRRAGCSIDFAPVLDLALDPRNTVVGTRAFGSDPQSVATFGAAFARGLQSGGASACFKHFPGHGATAIDSHGALPVVRADAGTWRGRDLRPFALVARDARAFMAAHLIATAFDADHPSSRSPRIAVDLLRRELGFAGALVTDCLFMAGAAMEGGPPDAAVASLIAGADVLLVSHGIDVARATVAAIVRAVEDGRLPLERLQEANARVLRLRAHVVPPLAVGARAPHPGIGRAIARDAVTLIRGDARVDPAAATLVSFESEAGAGAENARVAPSSLRREAPALNEYRLALEPRREEVTAVLARLASSARRALVLTRRAHLHAAQAEAVARIVEHDPNAVVVSVREPFDLAHFARARHLLATYGDDTAALGGLADVLFAGAPARGRLPLEVSVER